MSAERSWASLAGLLGSIDAVHGVYYALLHLWVGAFGPAEIATRLPSAIAVGVMVAGTVILVRWFATERTAVIAGVVCIVLPRTTYMAAEARSYAWAAAAAVWLTVLLVHLMRRHSGPGGWIGYSVAAAACIYLFLYLGLILVAHGAYIALLHRDRLLPWLRWAGLGLLLASPIIVIGYLQRGQIAFLSRRDYATPRNVFVSQWFGHPLVAVIGWALIAAAAVSVVIAVLRRRGMPLSRRRVIALALLWITLPSSILLLGNATVSPMYNVRYLSFCTPAVAILIALGAEVIGRLVTPRLRAFLPLGLVAALVVACVPVYLGQRTIWAKDGGSDWRVVAEYVSQNANDGDLIIFDQSTKPSRDPRIMAALYPTAFAGLVDIARTTPYTGRTHLWDAVEPNAVAVSGRTRPTSVWAVELPTGGAQPDDVTMLLHRGFSIESSQRIHRTNVFHLIKE
ncbi:MAG: glycosyltransferase family 39 protein [Microbacterium sp.]